MSEHNQYIPLIIAVTPTRGSTQTFVDKGGGEQHGLKEMLAGPVQKLVNVDALKANFHNCVEQVGSIISNLKNETVLGWEAESVSFSLAVSAEGSIGIATVGAEGTIEVTFKPRKNQTAAPAQVGVPLGR